MAHTASPDTISLPPCRALAEPCALRVGSSDAFGWNAVYREEGTAQSGLRAFTMWVWGILRVFFWTLFLCVLLQVLCFVHLLNELRAMMTLYLKDSHRK